MIAIDLDGTLLNSEKRISDEDSAALRQAVERGIEVVPVTGRNFSFALPVVEKLPFDVPLVTTNGAVIRSRSGETYMRRLLPVDAARQVLNAASDFWPYTVVVYDQPGAGHLRVQAAATSSNGGSALPGAVAASVWLQRNQHFVQSFDSLEQALTGDPLEILFTGPVQTVGEIGRRLAAANADSSAALQFRVLRTEYPNRDFAIMDAIHAECSKGAALEHWSRLRGISAAEIMAIGDNYNDIEMLQYAGFPVVMGNAEEALKKQGWPVTRDCDSAGVAHAIREYVLD
jgi:hydroxymethylpyrimidine pyrophosphatase-like HAD family hydrolase